MNYDFGFIFMHISLLMFILMFGYIVRIKNKKQIHYAFLTLIINTFVWAIGATGIEYCYRLNKPINEIMIWISYIGLIFTPVVILYLGIIFAKGKITFSWKHILIIIIPVISLILLFTNNYHHLFYKYIKYEDLTSSKALGNYFFVHTIYSYICIVIGLGYLMYYSKKNAGFFSKQSIFITIGIAISFIYNSILIQSFLIRFFILWRAYLPI